MAKTARDEDDAAARLLGEACREGAASAVHGRVLFLHAHAATLDLAGARGPWTCVQGLRPLAAALEARGCDVACALPGEAAPFDQALVLPPRQRDAARASLAQAVARVRSGGQVLAAVSNREGARSVEGDLAALAGDLWSRSRNKCRIFGATVDPDRIDRERLRAWRALDALQPILDGRYFSRPGLFAWDRVDAASALLAAHLPVDLAGRVADLGAGYGYLSTQILEHCPGVRALDLYEADARALEPLRRNVERTRAATDRGVATRVHWHDVTRGLPRRYDAIVTNPPFHAGRADRPDLGRAFIESAADALRPGGALWMVANRHLPYESTLGRRFAIVRAVAGEDGFKVLHAVRAGDGSA